MNLAPNGKPSNLTPEQYRLVRTPAFKKWFGDWEKAYKTGNYENVSKVIDDENGEPLVCYHATNKKFNVFDKNKIGTKNDSGTFGRGFYFDTLLDIQIRGEGTPITTWATKIILKCFLNIKNPKISEDVWFWKKGESVKYTNKIIKEGYDGIFVEGNYDGRYYPHWCIAFEPNQIKLADGTNTTFDGRNPDIRFAKGGLTMKKPKESDYSGEYGDLHQFIFHNDLQQVFADKYEINVDDWEDYAYGDFGTDEEVIEDLIGKGYKIFYNESDDEFVITKKKTGKLEYKIITLYNKKYNKDVLDVIEKSGIYSEYTPEFAVIVGKNVVGGSTAFVDEDNVYNFDIGILDKYQGYGISKKLIEKIITAAKEDIGVKAIKAYVVNDMLFRYLGEIGFSLSRDSDEQYAYMPIKKNKKYEFGGLTMRKPKNDV